MSRPSEFPALRSLPEFVLEPVADALLPWGDPYIIKLAQQLEREARDQIEAAFRETDDDDAAPHDFGQSWPVRRDAGLSYAFQSSSRPSLAWVN